MLLFYFFACVYLRETLVPLGEELVLLREAFVPHRKVYVLLRNAHCPLGSQLGKICIYYTKNVPREIFCASASKAQRPTFSDILIGRPPIWGALGARMTI